MDQAFQLFNREFGGDGQKTDIEVVSLNREFDDLFPCDGQPMTSSPQDLEISLDSPVSLDINNEEMNFFRNTHCSFVSPALGDDHFNSSSPHGLSPACVEDDYCDNMPPTQDFSPSPEVVCAVDDELIEGDRILLAERMRPYDKFPFNNDWTREQRIDRLLELSPCEKFSKEFLMNIDSVEDAEEKVDIMIELVCKIRLNFIWNYVEPHELSKPYTSATFCKKEKKKDAEGFVNPKRPMNAFMIWSKQCRSLISQVTPQLHNATISKKLGSWWRKFTDAEKDVFEKEKAALTAFHAHEFPEYKYRPRKKVPKKTDEKPESAPKEKTTKKRKSASSKPSPQINQSLTPPQASQVQHQLRQQPLCAINLSESVASITPAIQRKLHNKVSVKIDPDIRREVAQTQNSRGINIADIPKFQSIVRSLSAMASDDEPSPKRLCLQPIQVQQTSVPPAATTIIDLADSSSLAATSTVFDTPGNSPHTPVTPVSPKGSGLSLVTTANQQPQQQQQQKEQPCFDFTLASTQRLLMQHLTGSNCETVTTTIPTSIPIINTAVAKTNAGNHNIVVPVRNVLKTSPILIGTRCNKVAVSENNNNNSVQNNNVIINNNNIVHKVEPFIKPEPLSPQWSLNIKQDPDQFTSILNSEPVETNASHMAVTLKAEPTVFSSNFSPVLQAEPVTMSTTLTPVTMNGALTSFFRIHPVISADPSEVSTGLDVLAGVPADVNTSLASDFAVEHNPLSSFRNNNNSGVSKMSSLLEDTGSFIESTAEELIKSLGPFNPDDMEQYLSPDSEMKFLSDSSLSTYHDTLTDIMSTIQSGQYDSLEGPATV